MLADIATGHHAAADVLFLIAAIVAGLAAIATVRPDPEARVVSLGWVAVTLLAVGWLLL